MNLQPALFVSVFGLIFLAELPDKTALATLVLATRNHPVAVFIGAAGAFVVQSLVAVAFGSVFGLLPEHLVKIFAGLLFFAFAWAMWVRKEDDDEARELADRKADFKRTVSTAFAVIFVAEWGDLTQLATAALAAKHRQPLTIFLAATSALWTVTALAIMVGHNVKHRFHPRHLQKAAAIMFALVGAACMVR